MSLTGQMDQKGRSLADRGVDNEIVKAHLQRMI